MIKIYILLDVYLNDEYHTDFVDAFDNAEELANYIAEHQEDGHNFKIETREFVDRDNNMPSSPWPWTPNQPWTAPQYPQPLEPYYPGPFQPIISWQYKDGYYTTSTSDDANDIKLRKAHKTTSTQDKTE